MARRARTKARAVTGARAARGVCVALVTCPSLMVARRLAATLIRSHAAACVNILGPVESVFWWQGRVDRARERLLVIKTVQRNVPRIRELLQAEHPYSVPEFIVWPIQDGLPAYLRWVHESCRI